MKLSQFRRVYMDRVWVPLRVRPIRGEAVRGRRRFKVYGEWSGDKGITVAPEQTRHDEINTFVHEVLHRAMDECGVNSILGKELEETVVDGLTPWVIAFIRENKGLVKYVQGPGY